MVGDRLGVVDYNAAYTLDWAREAQMLGESPNLQKFVEQMYERSAAPSTIAEAFAAMEEA